MQLRSPRESAEDCGRYPGAPGCTSASSGRVTLCPVLTQQPVSTPGPALTNPTRGIPGFSGSCVYGSQAADTHGWKSVPVCLSNPKQEVWLPLSRWEIAVTRRNLKYAFCHFTELWADASETPGLGAGDSAVLAENLSGSGRHPDHEWEQPECWWNAGAPACAVLLAGSGCKSWTHMRKTKSFLIEGFDSSCLLEV